MKLNRVSKLASVLVFSLAVVFWSAPGKSCERHQAKAPGGASASPATEAAPPNSHKHSQTVCVENDTVCAHLGFMTPLNSSTEAKFMAHVMVNGDVEVKDWKVVLWMPAMGHGSRPVTLTPMDKTKVKVEKAFFIMPGDWVVRLSFSIDAHAYQIEIPVNIAD